MCGEVERKLVLWELTLLPPNRSQEWNTEGQVGSRCLYPLNNPFSTPPATRSSPQTLCGSLISFSHIFTVQLNTPCFHWAISIKSEFLPPCISLRLPKDPRESRGLGFCLFYQWLTEALFKTNSESNKAFPFCKRNRFNKPGNKQRCQV